MGWGSGVNNACREVGYLVDATCDQPGCDTDIDRGLAYCCGGMHDGGEHGCGGYFCPEHLGYANNAPTAVQFCGPCAAQLDEQVEGYWWDPDD